MGSTKPFTVSISVLLVNRLNISLTLVVKMSAVCQEVNQSNRIERSRVKVIVDIAPPIFS